MNVKHLQKLLLNESQSNEVIKLLWLYPKAENRLRSNPLHLTLYYQNALLVKYHN